jgi:hypothetical protein
MSNNNYSTGDKTISSITEYNSYIKDYETKKYTDITSTFKDNVITFGDININLKYNTTDIKKLTFLSGKKELVVVFLDKDEKKLSYVNISKNITGNNENIVVLNGVTFNWKSNATKSTSYTWLIILCSVILLMVILYAIYRYVKYKKNKITNSAESLNNDIVVDSVDNNNNI